MTWLHLQICLSNSPNHQSHPSLPWLLLTLNFVFIEFLLTIATGKNSCNHLFQPSPLSLHFIFYFTDPNTLSIIIIFTIFTNFTVINLLFIYIPHYTAFLSGSVIIIQSTIHSSICIRYHAHSVYGFMNAIMYQYCFELLLSTNSLSFLNAYY